LICCVVMSINVQVIARHDFPRFGDAFMRVYKYRLHNYAYA
jgi:hypothetical protein